MWELTGCRSGVFQGRERSLHILSYVPTFCPTFTGR
jgi:hypothetical protein